MKLDSRFVSGKKAVVKNYMVDLTDRLRQIKVMVDRGDYFTINRARQYGKTTMLAALEHYLQEDYRVISLDFRA